MPVQHGVEIDAGVGDEAGRGANRIVAEVKVPRRLANRLFQFRMGVLPFGQHAGPEWHVAEIPSGSERVRIPGVAPDMPDAVAGRAFDPASGIAGPGLLGLRVVAELDFPPLPHGVGAPVKPGIMLAAESRPVRVQGRVLPDPVRVDEIGVLERRLEDRRAAAPKIAFQGLDRRHEFAVVNAGFGQDNPPMQRASGGWPQSRANGDRPPQTNRVHNTA